MQNQLREEKTCEPAGVERAAAATGQEPLPIAP